ncbi:uncharacterized protein LOC124677236 isoform X2 [Lolium rigidum]|uniref:uncharacterized protein LOC124677236 isoform X2 n=1 Tax=Lolium rigidum TaxID=89674 RepID=UPI001F5CB4CD|nr:uncharacterized protein LOC124677236 isoform X2 [Lolium rigidum]
MISAYKMNEMSSQFETDSVSMAAMQPDQMLPINLQNILEKHQIAELNTLQRNWEDDEGGRWLRRGRRQLIENGLSLCFTVFDIVARTWKDTGQHCSCLPSSIAICFPGGWRCCRHPCI